MDLNLPQLDGREVLAEVRSDPRLNSIPTVIFTSSPAHEDVLLAQTFHADGYLRKPIRVAEFAALLARLDIVAPGRGHPTPEPDSHAATATSGSSPMEHDGHRAESDPPGGTPPVAVCDRWAPAETFRIPAARPEARS